MTTHENVKAVYKHGKPYGIRDENGYLFFFSNVTKFPGQDERYRKELQEQFELCDYLVMELRERQPLDTGG